VEHAWEDQIPPPHTHTRTLMCTDMCTLRNLETAIGNSRGARAGTPSSVTKREGPEGSGQLQRPCLAARPVWYQCVRACTACASEPQ